MKVLVIGGPTAAGKSELAARMAEALGGEVINADSAQIYRGMDIGTAKPGRELLDLVPHHLFDVAEISDPWDVKRYEEAAKRVVEDVAARGRLPVVVGGSGFYIKGLLEGVPEVPSGDPELRRRLSAKSPLELHRMLSELDPARARELHPNDVKRVVRALEICLISGRPASFYRWSGVPRWDVLKIAVDRERGELKARIEKRVEAMLDAGWLEEVRELAETYGFDNRVLASTLGYRELLAYLKGKLGFEEAVRLIKARTWRYSKRQRRWFRGEGFRFFVNPDLSELLRVVERWLYAEDNGGKGQGQKD